MLRGLYTAAKSMSTENKRVDILANNIANADTNGYKKDLVVTSPFSEVLISRLNDNSINDKFQPLERVSLESTQKGFKIETGGSYLVMETSRGKSYSTNAGVEVSPEGYLITTTGNFVMGQKGKIRVSNTQKLSIDERGTVFSDGEPVDRLQLSTAPNMIGTLNAGARADDIVTSFMQGSIKQTNCPTDLAIKGKGFFTVMVDGEERYSRDGSFGIDNRGFLVTKDGYKVMGEEGEIWIDEGSMEVRSDGEVYADGEWIDRLKLVSLDNPEALMKIGNNLYKARDEARISPGVEGEVLQGFIETSNVNTIKEMVNMVTAFRSYEANQRIVMAYDSMIEKAANEIGRV